MLRPDYLDGMPDRMVELYAQAEADILADMARRLQAYDYWVPSAEHQKKRLEQMGASMEYIYARLSALTGKREGELRQLFLEAATQALDSDRAYYLEAGLTPPTLDASAELQTVCNAGLRQTDGLFRNLTRTTAATGAGQFGDALDRAWLQISTGAFDTDIAVRRAVKALAEHGLDAVRYELTIDASLLTPDEYDSLYEVLCAPVASHVVVFPYGQTTYQFEAEILEGSDDLILCEPDYNHWEELTITFQARKPNRVPV